MKDSNSRKARLICFLPESETHSYRPGDGDVKGGTTGARLGRRLEVGKIQVTVEKKKDDLEGAPISRCVLVTPQNNPEGRGTVLVKDY